MFIVTTNNPEETERFGAFLSRCLPLNSVVALSGQLGSGKTTLVKGIARGMGIKPEEVNSPSFVLMREYPGKGRALFHCDLYRLEGVSQIAFLGLEDYFSRNGVLVIEWAQKADGLLPQEYLRIDINVSGELKRKLKCRARGKSYQEVIERLKCTIKEIC